MPMVTITIANAGWPRIGRSTSRSAPKPTSAMPAMAAGTASQNGRPAKVITPSAMKAPTIIRSPCAKLTVSVAL